MNTEITDIKDFLWGRDDAGFTAVPSAVARERMLARRGERMFVAGWHDVLMIHFEVDAVALQRAVPFELDRWQGRAWVSLVAFTMRGMRPVAGGKLGEWIFRPIATHDFLNVRTYVRHQGERGIHFIAEWLNSRMAAALGPVAFGLPYRHGRIEYQNDWHRDEWHGQVEDAASGGNLRYRAERLEPRPAGRTGLPRPDLFQPGRAGTLDEWLMERYIAFNSAGGIKRSFRVWHPPWPQCRARVTVEDKSLLTRHWPWFANARLRGANYSPGFEEVWMGRPHFRSRTKQRDQGFRHEVFFG